MHICMRMCAAASFCSRVETNTTLLSKAICQWELILKKCSVSALKMDMSGECVFRQFCLAAANILNGVPVLQLCYSSGFYSASKGKYTLEALGQADLKGGASVCLGFLFLYVFSPPRWACLMQIGRAKKGSVCFTWNSHSGPWIFFCSIFTGFFFSLSFSHCHFGLSSILTT